MTAARRMAESPERSAKRLFYTLKEAADLLHISPETYYRGVREGKFPGRKVGGQWRISCQALHRYAEAEGANALTGGDAA